MFDKHGSSCHQNQIKSHYSLNHGSFIPINTVSEQSDACVPLWNKFHNSTATIHKPFWLNHYCQSAAWNQFLHCFCIHIWPCTVSVCAFFITDVQLTIYKLSASLSHLYQLAIYFNEWNMFCPPKLNHITNFSENQVSNIAASAQQLINENLYLLSKTTICWNQQSSKGATCFSLYDHLQA
jgi:hypothetical protein